MENNILKKRGRPKKTESKKNSKPLKKIKKKFEEIAERDALKKSGKKKVTTEMVSKYQGIVYETQDEYNKQPHLGRRRIEINLDDVRKVAHLKDSDIMDYLGISHGVFYRNKHCFIEFRDILKKARAEKIHRAMARVEKHAEEGNLVADMFFLKISGYREKDGAQEESILDKIESYHKNKESIEIEDESLSGDKLQDKYMELLGKE